MNIIQKKTPNYDTGRQNKTIDKIVCHWIVGDLNAADAQFAKDSSDVSAHYAVGTTEIHQYVKEKDTAWHAGNYAMNLRSIGIEHRGSTELPIDEGTYKNSAELIADICKRNNIALDRAHIVKHSEVVATQCPGTLDLDKLISMAKDVNNPCEKELEEMRISRNKHKEKLDKQEKIIDDYTVKLKDWGTFLDKCWSILNPITTDKSRENFLIELKALHDNYEQIKLSVNDTNTLPEQPNKSVITWLKEVLGLK